MHNTQKQEDVFHICTCLSCIYNMAGMSIPEHPVCVCVCVCVWGGCIYICTYIFLRYSVWINDSHQLPSGTKSVRR